MTVTFYEKSLVKTFFCKKKLIYQNYATKFLIAAVVFYIIVEVFLMTHISF